MTSSSDPPDGTSAAGQATTMKEKILKRAELSRITRMLKSRLEIAQFKVGRSWQNLPFKSVEPQLEREARLRNPEAFVDSDAALEGHRTSTSSSPPPTTQGSAFLVPELPVRTRHGENLNDNNTFARQDRSVATTTTTTDRDADRTRPRVSPLKRRRSVSFERESPEPASSPIKHKASSQSLRESVIFKSPPSTPPPSHLRHHRRHPGKEDTEEGADLLLYLATSPSPAKSRKLQRSFEFSSPPPIRGSSTVNTPVGAGFNLSEFLNFTP